jgi:rare lipoprotein A (peptidoglycan hydrolase)
LLWNDLSDPTISTGQILVVAYQSATVNLVGPLPIEEELTDNNVLPAIDEEESETNAEAVVASSEQSLTENSETERVEQYSEKGIATWTRSTYDDGNFYALHGAAPKGTEMTVKNLMNNKTITVKIMGRLPATSENENVLIKISESAAKQLNVRDEKFLVQLEYAVSEWEEPDTH